MKISHEAKIGMMVLMSLIILAAISLKAGGLNFSKEGYTVRVQFHDINGLSLSSPVMFNGYRMGSVKDIAIKEVDGVIKMELTLWLKKEARLRQDARVYVKNLGFMGDKYVGIISHDNHAPYLPQGALLIGEEPADFGKLMQDGQEIVLQLKEISQNINERLVKNKETIDEILVGINETLRNIRSISGNLDALMKDNKKPLENMIIHLEATSRNLEEMSHDLKRHPWKIMYRSKEKEKERQR